jgi:hypothetical protein
MQEVRELYVPVQHGPKPQYYLLARQAVPLAAPPLCLRSAVRHLHLLFAAGLHCDTTGIEQLSGNLAC